MKVYAEKFLELKEKEDKKRLGFHFVQWDGDVPHALDERTLKSPVKVTLCGLTLPDYNPADPDVEPEHVKLISHTERQSILRMKVCEHCSAFIEMGWTDGKAYMQKELDDCDLEIEKSS